MPASRFDPVANEKKARKLRPLCWPVVADAMLREYRTAPFKVTMVEISRTGCQLRTWVRLRPGHLATLRIDAFGPWDARVEWNRDGLAALLFDVPIHISILHHIVRAHHLPATTEPSPAVLAGPATRPDLRG